MSAQKIKIAPRAQDYSQWYLDVARNGEMFEYSPTPGCITFLPKSVAIWERIKDDMNRKLKQLGVQNLLLPALIPMSFFERERQHVDGFAPELAVVTHGGGKELDEKLAFRPTSEVMFCEFFKNRLQSWRDLPMLYNQWVNVLRWEKRTRPFLRTSEFHWQEGHTIHETTDEALAFAETILNSVYIPTVRHMLAIDGIAGIKPDSEKFAGADVTMSYEPMMSNGWALQICTSHVLGKGFMESFDVSYLDRSGEHAHPAYTSWGLSTRTIGAMISSHSDDKGLVIPPRLSEYSVVLLPIYGKDPSRVHEYTDRILQALGHQHTIKVPVSGLAFAAVVETEHATLIDQREARVGEKITDWERSGYPIRIEYGARDIDAGTCIAVSRITGERREIPLRDLQTVTRAMLANGQAALLAGSAQRLRDKTVACRTQAEAIAAVGEGNFALLNWDLDPKFEADIKAVSKATIRCFPFAGQWTDDLLAQEPGKRRTLIARNF
jgi:prolyl-tRNA synthetase